MNKMILGVVWQILGFLGASIIVCSAAPHRWDYDGITGLLGSLLGLHLVIPLAVCIVLFAAGALLCLKEIQEK